MRRKRKTKKRKKYTGLIIAFVIILITLLAAIIWKMVSLEKEEKQIEETIQPTIEFPYSVDDGKLEIISLFQSNISNPDCNEEMGEDIASIEVKNQSGQFLASATITVILDDDTKLRFEISDIPADGIVWAFEAGNAEIPGQPICKMVECETAYEDTTPVMEDQLSIEAEETTVTICNLTDMELANLTASFHCLFDEGVYYGGSVYTYPIDKIQAGESISLEVSECYLGKAQAVRVIQNNDEKENE